MTFYYIIYPHINLKKAIPRRHTEIKTFLKKFYKDLLDKYKAVSVPPNKIEENAPIWFCWFQGKDHMPDIVKVCYHSIIKNNPSRIINVIDFNNLKSWIDIPPVIQEAYKSNNLSLAHYADYCRVRLLKTYGGIWVDATILCNAPLVNINNYSFYSIKNEKENQLYVSDYKWSVNFLCSSPNNPLFSILEEMFVIYFSKFKKTIDYFLLDYFIAVLYDELPAIRQMIDMIPYNNPDFNHFIEKINTQYKQPEYLAITKENQLFKLSWKKEYLKTVNFDNETYWSKLYELYREPCC